jgi:succinate dehydrogenase / fumarate reductase flavoprotein subunit
LAPRDIVARAIQTEINEGRGYPGGYVLLDLRHLGRRRILRALPGIRELCVEFGGLDPIDDLIPIQPGQHYSMGGIDTDLRCRTEFGNLYAVGECGCVSVHGANRLGGNSLLDCVVFGRLAAEDINARQDADELCPSVGLLEDRLRQERGRLERLFERRDGMPYVRIRDELRQVMVEKCGIFRSRDTLAEGVERIGGLKQQLRSVACRTPPSTFNYELLNVLELECMLHLGDIVLRGGLAREESRGSHFRTDFPARDDEKWLRHTQARLEASDIRLTYTDVDTSLHEPAERKF